MNIFKRMNKAFVSKIDQFMQQFDQKHTKSNSQEKEIQKHKDIFEHRDHKVNQKKSSSRINWPKD